ncbi:MAG: DUF2520 domain-containing protein [Vicingus serpentipes]|nr:DUF2520 domain-containing protein [Vicingus serpentipes]
MSIIGSGNVANHLGKAFYQKRLTIKQVYSQSIENATVLAQQINATPIANLDAIKPDADCYIISIKDDAIESVLEHFPFKNKLIAHTAGGLSIEVFKKYGFTNYGVFYPLQTFSKNKKLDLSAVPFCIEANNELNQNLLTQLAQQLSNSIYPIDSEQRKTLHVAAVFACNFPNYLYHIAEKITAQQNMDFNILKPLIQETAEKIITHSPSDTQTGPAIRNDQEIIKNHIQMLADFKDYQDIYQLLTNSIIKEKTNGEL